ncbi:MAG: hypothetical protein GYA24_23850, partial [Candidatus Lokiarchaeota archaeon]|nr:hypothetical protein [Candidatus Lokiarchaeota archaeon]
QKMLAGAEEHMYKNGFEIGILFTGSPSFYRHAGWVQATNEPYCALQVSKLANQAASGFTFRWLDRSDRVAATRLYEDFNKDRPLTRIRDEIAWERRIDRQGEKHKYLGAFLGGTLIGYCGIEFHGGKDARLDIGEYAISTRGTAIEEGRVLEAMLGHVNALAITSGSRRVGTSLPATYPLSARMRASGAEVKDGWWSPMMILVINVPAFVEKLGMYQERVVIPSIDPAGIARVADFCIGLAIEDPRGTDPVVVQYAKTRDRVSVRANPPGRPSNLVPISRGQLALLAFGNFTPRMLVESGNWACPEALLDPLAAFFPTVAGTVYPRDHF